MFLGKVATPLEKASQGCQAMEGLGALYQSKRVDEHWVGFVLLDILTCVSPDTATSFVHN